MSGVLWRFVTGKPKTIVAIIPNVVRRIESRRQSTEEIGQPAQTQALPPESAQISAAIRSCSSLGASWGSPSPP